MSENRALRRIFRPEREKIIGIVVKTAKRGSS
jgi:hypothetical protein